MSEYLVMFIIGSMGSGRMGGKRLPSLKTIAGAVKCSLHWTIHTTF